MTLTPVTLDALGTKNIFDNNIIIAKNRVDKLDIKNYAGV